MPVKISHESPLELLGFSRTYNDYDYALVHLFDVYPEYLKFFKESLSKDRIVYLDNSYFELGHPYDESKYVKYINELGSVNNEKFFYVLPDVPNKEISEFISKYRLPGKRIGVVHGDTPEEVIENINFLKNICDVVAIPYIFKGISREHLILDHLEPTHVLDGLKIHLLGCKYPQEFKSYINHNWFFSLDTSNPVLHGIKHIRYTNTGLDFKDKTLLADVLNIHVDDTMLDDIKYNVKKFKELLNV